MNTRLRTFATIFIICAVALTPAFASKEERADKLLQSLTNLKSASSSTIRVQTLVLKLTRLYPSRAARFYKIGLRRISTSQPYGAQKIANAVISSLEKLGIPPNDAKVIEKAIELALIEFLEESAIKAEQGAVAAP